MSDSAPSLNCPTCHKPVQWTDAFPFRPFCSKRCQQIDFGDWAMERHSIPGDPAVIDSGLGSDDDDGYH